MIRRWLIKRLGGQVARRSIPASIRQAVYRRDGLKCRYCGSTQGPFQIDHVNPVALGGDNSPDNLVVSCSACNHAKGIKRWRPSGGLLGCIRLPLAFVLSVFALLASCAIIARVKPLHEAIAEAAVIFLGLVIFFLLLGLRKLFTQ